MQRLLKVPMIVTLLPLTILLACLASRCTPAALRIGALWEWFAFVLIAVAVHSFSYPFYRTKKCTYCRYILLFVCRNIALYSFFLLISWLLLMLSKVDWM